MIFDFIFVFHGSLLRKSLKVCLTSNKCVCEKKICKCCNDYITDKIIAVIMTEQRSSPSFDEKKAYEQALRYDLVNVIS